MAGIRHQTVVNVPDDPSSPVGSSDWNDDHTVTGNVDWSTHNINFGSSAGIVDASTNKMLVFIPSTSSGTPDEYLAVRNSVNAGTSGSGNASEVTQPSLIAMGPGTNTRLNLKTVTPQGERIVLQLAPTTANDANPSYTYVRITNAINHGAAVIEAVGDGTGHAPLSLRSFGTDSVRVDFTATLSTASTNIFEVNQRSSFAVSAPYQQFSWFAQTPAPGDFWGGIYTVGKTSGSGFTYGHGIEFNMTDVSSNAAASVINFQAYVAGSELVNCAKIGAGLIVGPSTVLPGAGNVRCDAIELGHNTDTTLSRTTSKVLAIEGVPVASPNIAVDVTTAYTLAMTDAAGRVEIDNSSAAVVTIPSSASVNFPDGTYINIARKGSGSVTLTTGAGVTLLSRSSARILTGQYSVATVYKSSANSWIAYGDLSTV